MRPSVDAAVVSVQNGIGNEDVIAEVVPQVVRGSIVTAGAVTEPGVVRYDAPGDSWFGPFEPSPASVEEIDTLAGLLTQGGLRTHAMADARGPQWTKVVFNAATSPLAALTGLPMGPLCTDPALRAQVDALVDEALAVCDAAGITLLKQPVGVVHRGDRDRVGAQALDAAGRPGPSYDGGRRAQRRHRRRGPPAGRADPSATTRWSRSCTASRAPGDPFRGPDQDDLDTGLDICRTPGRNLAANHGLLRVLALV